MIGKIKYMAALAGLAAPLLAASTPAQAANTYCSYIAPVGAHTLSQYQENWTQFNTKGFTVPVTAALYNDNVSYSVTDFVTLANQDVNVYVDIGHVNIYPATESGEGWHIITYEC